MSPHDVLLKHLQKSFTVRLLARLDDAAAAGNTREKYLHVFVPDMHLVSAGVRAKYTYGFDHAAEFSSLTTALLAVDTELAAVGHWLRVTQLGDFLDLWRESANKVGGVKAILESFPDIRDRFLRNARGSVGADLILGNHDLEARGSRNFGRARLTHYASGVDNTIMITHGDAFDLLETIMPDKLQALAVNVFGKLVDPRAYPMKELKTLRDTHTPQNQASRIQGDAVFVSTTTALAAVPNPFNVITVDQAGERKQAHKLLPNLCKTVRVLRQSGLASAPEVTKVKIVVIGHSHHARLIHDRREGLVLMDCGAWIESHQVGNGPKRPNRQLGVICGSDMRIYQLD